MWLKCTVCILLFADSKKFSETRKIKENQVHLLCSKFYYYCFIKSLEVCHAYELFGYLHMYVLLYMCVHSRELQLYLTLSICVIPSAVLGLCVCLSVCLMHIFSKALVERKVPMAGCRRMDFSLDASFKCCGIILLTVIATRPVAIQAQYKCHTNVHNCSCHSMRLGAKVLHPFQWCLYV